METTAAYEARAERLKIHVRVAPDQMGSLADTIGEEAVQAAIRLEEPDPDGWTHLRLVVEWPHEAHARLLALGAFAEVLEPPELRARILAAARDIIDRYATVSTAPLVSAAAGGSAGTPPRGSGS